MVDHLDSISTLVVSYMEDDLVLYILMRKDMASLNHTGKAIAQAAHAANHAAESIAQNQFGTAVMAQFSRWQKQSNQGFGTTLVMGGYHSRYNGDKPATIYDIRKTVGQATLLQYAAAVVIDPSYPLLDGSTLHNFPCETCGWVFGSKEALTVVMCPYLLHPEAPGYSP